MIDVNAGGPIESTSLVARAAARRMHSSTPIPEHIPHCACLTLGNGLLDCGHHGLVCTRRPPTRRPAHQAIALGRSAPIEVVDRSARWTNQTNRSPHGQEWHNKAQHCPAAAWGHVRTDGHLRPGCPSRKLVGLVWLTTIIAGNRGTACVRAAGAPSIDQRVPTRNAI